MKTAWAVAYTLIGGLLGAGLLFLLGRQPTGTPIQLQPLPTPSPTLVHVTGAVQHPGVYALPAGSRVRDAIQAAGGFSPEADTQAINLAAFVQDGGRILVLPQGLPTQPAAPPAGRSPEQGILFPVNLNTASQAELEALPEIGPATAQNIIAYRQEHGGFQTIEELIDVPDIGPVTFEKIKDLVIVEGAP